MVDDVNDGNPPQQPDQTPAKPEIEFGEVQKHEPNKGDNSGGLGEAIEAARKDAPTPDAKPPVQNPSNTTSNVPMDAEVVEKVVAKAPGFFAGIKQAFSGELLKDVAVAEREASFGKDVGFFTKVASRISGNLGKGGWGGRSLAIGGLAGTVGFGGALLLNGARLVGIVPLKQDEQGKDKPVGFMGIAIPTAGVAASLATAAIGGHKRAMGLSS